MIGPFQKICVRSLECLIIGLMTTLVLDVTWQVVSRYLLGSPSSWTDELATLLMIWVAMLGASLGFIRQAHLGIDYFVHLLPLKAAKVAQLAVQLMIAFFAGAILLYGGLELVKLTLRTEQVSPALGLKMGLVYLAIPLSGCYILAFAAADAIALIRRPQAAPAARAD